MPLSIKNPAVVFHEVDELLLLACSGGGGELTPIKPFQVEGNGVALVICRHSGCFLTGTVM